MAYVPPPNHAAIRSRYRHHETAGWVMLGFGGLGLLFASAGAGVLLVGLALMGAGMFMVTARSRAVRSAHRHYDEACARAQAEHHAARTSWQAQRDQWFAQESQRVEAIPMYYVMTLPNPKRRLDVFGGQVAGWACLLNTLARPLVDDGVGVSVLDFTEASVAIELGLHARDAGKQVRQCLLPEDLSRADLLHGLDAADVADVLVSSAHAVRHRKGREDDEHWEVDRAIVAEVCRLLEPGGLTVRRIIRGLDVVSQAARSHDDDTLSAEEVTSLEESGYLSATTDRVRQRYSYLRPLLEPLAGMAADASEDVAALPRDGDISILAVQGRRRRESSLLANLVTQCVLHRADDEPVGANLPLVFVAGADLLTAETIRTLSRRAAQAGVRTAFLFADLDDDARRVLGTDGSETLFLQLQNHEQARHAAEFIGRRHRFVLGQITKSVGDSLGGSRGESRSWSQSTSATVGESATYTGMFRIFADAVNKSRSETHSFTDTHGTQWSDTWQKTESYGETATRVYEYETEPRTLQELDTSSFVFVSHAGGRTRISAGDCNPGLEHVPYAVSYPREDCPLRR